jgi:hypothetical protein
MSNLAHASTDFVLPYEDGGHYYLFDGNSAAIAEVKRELFDFVTSAAYCPSRILEL